MHWMRYASHSGFLLSSTFFARRRWLRRLVDFCLGGILDALCRVVVYSRKRWSRRRIERSDETGMYCLSCEGAEFTEVNSTNFCKNVATLRADTLSLKMRHVLVPWKIIRLWCLWVEGSIMTVERGR